MICAANLYEYMQAHGIKKITLARKLKRAPKTVRTWLGGTRDFSPRIIGELNAVLGEEWLK